MHSTIYNQKHIVHEISLKNGLIIIFIQNFYAWISTCTKNNI